MADATVGAFRADDAGKSRDTILYERNTHRKQAKELRAERDALINRLDAAKDAHRETVMSLHIAIHNAATEDAVWAYYDKYITCQRVFTRDSTGHKTHQGRATVDRVKTIEGKRTTVKEEIDAHITEEGRYYKPWAENDKPCYYLKETRICRENFTLTAAGTFIPIKKY